MIGKWSFKNLGWKQLGIASSGMNMNEPGKAPFALFVARSTYSYNIYREWQRPVLHSLPAAFMRAMQKQNLPPKAVNHYAELLK